MSPVFADEPAALRQPKKRLPIFAGALWASMFIIFMASPVLQMNDSLYSMLTAESLIQNRSPDLIHYSIPTAEFDRRYRGYPLARTNGRLLYGFAHGSSFLSIPFVALMNELGVSPATRDLKFDFRGELIIQKVQAAFVSASAVAVFFLTAALLLDLQWSTVIAVGAGLGTQVWSTASRGMWQHTWEIMLGSLVVYLLLATETRRTSVRPILLATLLSWMFFVRPTGVVPVICTAAYVYGRRRSEFPWFAAAGLGWLTAFIAYSWRIFGTPVPFYYFSFARPVPWDNPVKFQPMTALYGTLISPSRGLFVFCPVIAWVLFVNIQFWRSLKSTALATTALFAGAGIWLVVLSHAGLVGWRVLRSEIFERRDTVVRAAGDYGSCRDSSSTAYHSQPNHFGGSGAFNDQHSDERRRCVVGRNDGMEFQGPVAGYHAGLVAAPVPRRLARPAVRRAGAAARFFRAGISG